MYDRACKPVAVSGRGRSQAGLLVSISLVERRLFGFKLKVKQPGENVTRMISGRGPPGVNGVSPPPPPRSGAPPPDGPVPAGGSVGSGQRAHPPHRRAAAAPDPEELPPVPVRTRDAVQASVMWKDADSRWQATAAARACLQLQFE